MPRVTHVRTALTGTSIEHPEVIDRARSDRHSLGYRALRCYIPCPISIAALRWLSKDYGR
jgi:ribosomal protein L15E